MFQFWNCWTRTDRRDVRQRIESQRRAGARRRLFSPEQLETRRNFACTAPTKSIGLMSESSLAYRNST